VLGRIGAGGYSRARAGVECYSPLSGGGAGERMAMSEHDMDAPPPRGSGPEIDVRYRLGSGATSAVAYGVLSAPFGELAVGTELAVKRPHPDLRADARVRAAFEA